MPSIELSAIFYYLYDLRSVKNGERYFKTTQGRESLRKMLKEYDVVTGDKHLQKVYY